MYLHFELKKFRETGELPANLSRRFLCALKRAERAELFERLRSELVAEAETGEATDKGLLTLCLRVSRLQKVRREKGELTSDEQQKKTA